MNFFLPNNITRVLTMTVLCVVYAALQALAFYWMVSFSYLALFLIALSEAAFFALLSIFLYKAIRFGNYVVLEPLQRFINYLALGLLSVGLWMGESLLALYVVAGKENISETWQTAPMKAFIGILLYILAVQLIHNWIETENNVLEEDEDTMPAVADSAEAIEILDRVVVKTGQKIHVISVPDIVYIQSDGDYVQIYTPENHFLKEETMKNLETHLPPEMFVRVHRSYIVNVEKILRIELYEKKNQVLTLSNGHKIKASASGYKLLREALNL